MRHGLSIAAVAAGLLAAASMAGTANAQDGVKAGFLSCDVAGNVSFIFGSTRSVECRYTPESGDRVDLYGGEINQFGLDIGYQSAGVMLWAVLAPTSDAGPGALAGQYVGVGADVALGVGVGANVLVGGSRRSISLQPLVVEGIRGVNIAAGVASLTLEAR